MSDYIKREDAVRRIAVLMAAEAESDGCEDQPMDNYIEYALEDLADIPSADVVPIELVAEMFGNTEPCNFGLFGVSVDDFMYSECGDWCERNCDNVPAVECWKKFFKMWEERKNTWTK